MIGRKISHYKVLEEIGAGGMGIVYKAEDSRLNRTVALKFVVPRIVRREEDRERFIREAQTAASINHPNICTIYEIEEEGDNLFIAMEYVEGQSLKEIVDKGPIKIESVLDAAIQIVDGLKEAHAVGVVHRDIKSSNILITKKGQAKIMDFGLAKPLEESKITETATIMGTIAYMSPEQASGEAFDHRTDIWSFGVVLYEMLSGQLPFGGEPQQLVLYAILNQNPQPIKNLPYALPFELDRIINKCLEKEPNERYRRADELLEDLRRLKRETETGIVLPRKKIRDRTRIAPSIAIVTTGILLCVALLLFAGYFIFEWFRPSMKWKTSIAVLPIEDLSIQEENVPLCVGSTRNIIFKLAKFSPELRVVPHDSVKRYRDSERDSIEIGEEFNVEYVLVSSFSMDGESVQINSELIDVKTNTNILPISEKFGLNEIFDIEDEISRKIVGELGLHFTEKGLIAAKRRETNNPEAYKWYVKGMHTLDLQNTYPDTEIDEWFAEVTGMFQEAIKIDPNYALAYWGLGSAYEAYYVERKKEEDLEKMLYYYEKAYEIDPELAEANIGLGWAYFYKQNLNQASESFERALELESNSSLINCDVGAYLYSIGLFHSAIKYFSKAIQIEPSYLRAYVLSAACHWNVGEFDQGVKYIERALDQEKSDTRLYFVHAKFLIMMKKFSEAEKVIAEAESMDPGSSNAKHHRALLWAVKGDKNKTLSLIGGVDGAFDYCITCSYSLLGMRNEAIENIKKGIEMGFERQQYYLYSYLLLSENPCFDSLRGDPNFEDILKKQADIYDQRRSIHKDLL